MTGRHARPDDDGGTNPFAERLPRRRRHHPRESVPDWALRMENRIMSEIDDLAAVVADLGAVVASVETTVSTLENEVANASGDTLDRQRVTNLVGELRGDLTRLQTVAASAPVPGSSGAPTPDQPPQPTDGAGPAQPDPGAATPVSDPNPPVEQPADPAAPAPAPVEQPQPVDPNLTPQPVDPNAPPAT